VYGSGLRVWGLGCCSVADENQSASLSSASFLLKTETGWFGGLPFSFFTTKLAHTASLLVQKKQIGSLR